MCRNLIKENNKEYIYNSGRLVRVVEGNTLIQEIMYDETKDKYKPINLIVNGSREDLRYEGRRLIGIGKDISYEYDGEGRRISKTVKGNKEEYKYEGERLVKIIKEGREIEVLYDIKGEIVGLKNEEGYYYYRKDALGNIERIIDSTGKTIVKYEYSVWGELIEEKKIENKKIVEDNPYKYKSYYYDKESGLYYLKSRYYSASLHRFISLDQTEYMEIRSITGLNLYVYCGNDPVNMADPEGQSAILVIGLLVGSFIVGAGASVVSQGLTYGWNTINYWQAGLDGLFALGSTALAMTGIGALISAEIGAVAGWLQYAIDSAFHGEDLTLLGSITAASLGFIGGRISGAGARNSSNIVSNMKLTGKGASALKAITTASNRYLAGEISMNGLQATISLWGNVALNAMQDAAAPTINSLMIKSTIAITAWTIATVGINYGFSYLN